MINQPLGYYIIKTPFSGSIFNSLQTKYGQHFENLNRKEKLFLISSIASILCQESKGKICHDIYAFAADLHDLISYDDKHELMGRMTSNIRWTRNDPTENHQEALND